MSTFGKICISIVLLTGSSLFAGLVFVQLWEWFIAKPFHLPVLTLPHGIGITCLVGMVTVNEGREQKDNETTMEYVMMGTAKSFFKSLLLFGSGWIVSLFL